MRATVEHHEDGKDELPSIKAKVTLGMEDLSVKVSPIQFSHKFWIWSVFTFSCSRVRHSRNF